MRLSPVLGLLFGAALLRVLFVGRAAPVRSSELTYDNIAALVKQLGAYATEQYGTPAVNWDNISMDDDSCVSVGTHIQLPKIHETAEIYMEIEHHVPTNVWFVRCVPGLSRAGALVVRVTCEDDYRNVFSVFEDACHITAAATSRRTSAAEKDSPWL